MKALNRLLKAYSGHVCYCENCREKVRVRIKAHPVCPRCGKKTLKPLKRAF